MNKLELKKTEIRLELERIEKEIVADNIRKCEEEAYNKNTRINNILDELDEEKIEKLDEENTKKVIFIIIHGYNYESYNMIGWTNNEYIAKRAVKKLKKIFCDGSEYVRYEKVINKI